MNPKRFLAVAGVVLITIGILGIVRLLGSISPASFFHPPYWINWFHLSLGIFVSVIAKRGTLRLQANITLLAAIMGLTLGVAGLLLGSWAATHFAMPELADPSDHFAHLLVGLVAIWSWRHDQKK